MKASVPKLFGCPGAPLSSSPFPGPQLSGVVRCPHRLLNLQHRRIAPASALGSPSVPLCSSPDLLRAITFRSQMISSPCFQVLLPLNLLHQQDRSRLCSQSFRCSQALAPEQSNNLAHSSLNPSRKQPLETPSSPIHSFAPAGCLGEMSSPSPGPSEPGGAPGSPPTTNLPPKPPHQVAQAHRHVLSPGEASVTQHRALNSRHPQKKRPSKGALDRG